MLKAHESSVFPGRGGHMATVLNGQMVLLSGFYSYTNEENGTHLREDTLLESVTIYNPSVYKWSIKKVPGQAGKVSLSSGCACVLNGLIWLFGGHVNSHQNHEHPGVCNTLRCLDLAANEWRIVNAEGDVPCARDKMCCWTWHNSIIMFGGYGPLPERHRASEALFVVNHTFDAMDIVSCWNNSLHVLDIWPKPRWTEPTCTGQRPVPRAAHAAAQLGRYAYVFGGRFEETRRNDIHCLDLETFHWSGELQTSGAKPLGRSWATLTPCGPDTLLLCGGLSNTSDVLDDMWLFDTKALHWQRLELHDMQPRYWHVAVGTGETVHVVGGFNTNVVNVGSSFEVHNDTVLTVNCTPLPLRELSMQLLIKCLIADLSWAETINQLPKRIADEIFFRKTSFLEASESVHFCS